MDEGRLEHPPGARLRVRAELGRPDQRGAGAAGVAVADRRFRDHSQAFGEFFVRSGRRTGEVPGLLDRIRGERRGERLLGPAALEVRGGLDDRQAVGGRGENGAAAGSVDRHHTRLFGGRESLEHVMAGRGRLKQDEVTALVQRGQQQHFTSGSGQEPCGGPQRSAETLTQRKEGRQRLLPGAPPITERVGQLQQGQRISGRLGDQPVPHARSRARVAGLQQSPSRGVVQRAHPMLRKSAEVENATGAGPGCRLDEQPYPAAGQPTGHEGQDQRGRLVELVAVLDHDEQGPGRARQAEQRQHGGGDPEAGRQLPGNDPLGDQQRLTGRPGQMLEMSLQGAQQPVQRRILRRTQGCAARRPEDLGAHAGSVPVGGIEQDRLSGPGPAGYEQRAAGRDGIVHERAHHRHIGVPARQHLDHRRCAGTGAPGSSRRERSARSWDSDMRRIAGPAAHNAAPRMTAVSPRMPK